MYKETQKKDTTRVIFNETPRAPKRIYIRRAEGSKRVDLLFSDKEELKDFHLDIVRFQTETEVPLS